MSLHYAYEKLDSAIHTLATNPYEIKSRLHGAWSHMSTLSTESHNLTQSMIDKFSTIEKRLTSATIYGDKDIIQESIDKMTNEEASEIAKDIFALYREVLSVYEEIGN